MHCETKNHNIDVESDRLFSSCNNVMRHGKTNINTKSAKLVTKDLNMKNPKMDAHKH